MIQNISKEFLSEKEIICILLLLLLLLLLLSIPYRIFLGKGINKIIKWYGKIFIYPN